MHYLAYSGFFGRVLNALFPLVFLVGNQFAGGTFSAKATSLKGDTRVGWFSTNLPVPMPTTNSAGPLVSPSRPLAAASIPIPSQADFYTVDGKNHLPLLSDPAARSSILSPPFPVDAKHRTPATAFI